MEKTKVEIVSSSSFETKNRSVGNGWAFFIFRERDSTFSLDFRSIGSSVIDGARNKVALRSEGYA